MVADDQYVNTQSMRFALTDLGVADRAVFFSNGQQLVEYAQHLLDESLSQQHSEPHNPIQPISLVLLDVNMPILSGMETLVKLTEMFGDDDSNRILRPMICYLSQYDGTSMKMFLKEDEFADYYL